ncbi:MAG: alpha/beta hydrolase [Pseudomonadota bacterium]
MTSATAASAATTTAFERSDVHFRSGSDVCHAWLYRPASAAATEPLPVIVMAHGLGAIKRGGLAAFAERFCAEGYACLVFDYRYFGDSGGEPRELLDIPSQLDDWRAALAYVRSLPEMDPDRVIVWGTSFAGGHAIVMAAEDTRVAAAIAQCPFTDGLASVKAIDWKTNIKLSALALRDIAAARLGRAPVRVHAVGEPGEAALMTSADAMDGYNALVAATGCEDVSTLVSARIGLQIPFHTPGRRAKDVKCPMLFSVCQNDSVAPAKATLKHAARAPKGEIKLYPEGHFDIYLGEPFERNISDQIAFLRKHIPAQSS